MAMAQSSRGSSGGKRKRATDAKPAGKRKAPAKGKSVEARAKAPARRRKVKPPAETPKGPRLDALARYLQASFIGIRRSQKATWPTIAREVGLSVRQCEMLLKQIAAHDFSHTLSRDPTELIEWLLAEHERDMASFTLAALEANTGAELVGALNGRGKSLERITALLQATGRLPKNLGVMRHIHDLQLVGRQINVLMVGIESGTIEREHVEAFFRRLTGREELPVVEADEVRELAAELVA